MTWRAQGEGQLMDLHVALPAFELDCRDWLVATEEDGILDDEVGAGPVVAVLSTMIIEDAEFYPGTVVLSIALLDELYRETLGVVGHGFHPDVRWSGGGLDDGSARFFAPSPHGGLALLAEFSSPPRPPAALPDRFRALLHSLRWAA